MSIDSLLVLAERILTSINPGELSDETIDQLRFVFSDELVFASLVLIDQESVIKHVSPWGRTRYEVLGSTGVQVVIPQMMLTSSMSMFCTCPSFAYFVLVDRGKPMLMCKHILATRIAMRLGRCVERRDELAAALLPV